MRVAYKLQSVTQSGLRCEVGSEVYKNLLTQSGGMVHCEWWVRWILKYVVWVCMFMLLVYVVSFWFYETGVEKTFIFFKNK
jgi:hypothetical protein